MIWSSKYFAHYNISLFRNQELTFAYLGMSTIYLTSGKYKVAAQNQQNFFFRHHTDSWKCKENSVFGSLLNNCVCNQKVKIIPFLKILMHSLNRRLLLGFPTNVNTLEVSKNINFILFPIWGYCVLLKR